MQKTQEKFLATKHTKYAKYAKGFSWGQVGDRLPKTAMNKPISRAGTLRRRELRENYFTMKALKYSAQPLAAIIIRNLNNNTLVVGDTEIGREGIEVFYCSF